jgi:hypothetical protein
MNVTTIVLEQLDWDGRLRSLVYSGRSGASFWIAEHGEYKEDRRTPFHFIDDRERRAFEREFQRVRPRTAGSLVRTPDGVRFATTWRGLPTDRSGLSVYALLLPEEATPIEVRFTDPQSARPYSFRGSFDAETRRVVLYLECRSQYGSFDFDLRIDMRRDKAAARSFDRTSSSTRYSPDLGQLEQMMQWGPNAVEPAVVHNYFMSSGSQVITAGERSVISTSGDISGPVVIGDVHGTIGSIGNHGRGDVTEPIDPSIVRVLVDERDAILVELRALQRADVDDATMASARRAELALESDDQEAAARGIKALGHAGLRLARDLGINLLAALIAASLGIGA